MIHSHSLEMTHRIVEPGECHSFSAFLKWWFDRIDENSGTRYLVNTQALDKDFKRSAEEVILASGHRLDAGATGASILCDPFIETFIISETIFVDTERDDLKIYRYWNYYKRALESIRSQKYVSNTLHVHLTHCSIDKEIHVISLAKLINQLNCRSLFSRFVLSLYEHPEGGYPKPKTAGPDARILPNKMGDRANRLAQRSLSNLVGDFPENVRIVRMALDDDDIWLPWTMEEVNRVAQEISEDELLTSTYAVGLGRQCFYYPDQGGRVDIADSLHIMTGSKFYLGSDWSILSSKNPWSLPESFAANMARRFEKQRVELKAVRNARPCFVYVRSRGALSSLRKEQGYNDQPMVLENIGLAEFALEAIVSSALADGPVDTPVFKEDPPYLFPTARYDVEQGKIIVSANIREVLESRDIPIDGAVPVLVFLDDNGWNEKQFLPDQVIGIPRGTVQGRMTLNLFSIDSNGQRANERILGSFVRGAGFLVK